MNCIYPVYSPPVSARHDFVVLTSSTHLTSIHLLVQQMSSLQVFHEASKAAVLQMEQIRMFQNFKVKIYGARVYSTACLDAGRSIVASTYSEVAGRT
jgi:hypothetical protein